MSQYESKEVGTAVTKDYRIYFTGANGVPVSPFHDIPLRADATKQTFHMVVEVPRWTNAKMEIDTKSPLNPIKQDVKKGELRFVKNCFPHHGYIWNYGAMPQTWEAPEHIVDPENPEKEGVTEGGYKGDNDPLDVCEIGQKVHARGAVIEVKVLGIMAMIDEGEMDWKVLAIDVKDPLADSLNDVEDIKRVMPGFLEATYEWFRIYKMPDGKPENKFAFNGEAKNKAFALSVINQTHKLWQGLLANKGGEGDKGIACKNTTVIGSPYHVNADKAKEILESTPPYAIGEKLKSEVDKWHYVTLPGNL